MNYNELNREQINELKERELVTRMEACGEWPSWSELAEADDLISDDELRELYAGTTFTTDDFFCTAGI